MFDFVKSYFNEEDTKSFFEATDDVGHKIFHFSSLNVDCKKPFSTVWECLADVYSNDQLQFMLSYKRNASDSLIMPMVVSRNVTGILDLIWILKTKMPVEFQREILSIKFCASQMNILMILACKSTHDFLKIIWRFMKCAFKKEELGEILFETESSDSSNVLHIACRYGDKMFVTSLLNIIQKTLTEEDTKSLIKKITRGSVNILQLATNNVENSAVYETLMIFLKKILSKEEVEKML